MFTTHFLKSLLILSLFLQANVSTIYKFSPSEAKTVFDDSTIHEDLSSTVDNLSVYIEPTLAASQQTLLSVIVTAQDAQLAEDAVERLGGQITSRLWLIDSVGAELPASQLAALANTSGIVSIVDNKNVDVAAQCDLEEITSYRPCASRAGWVTDRLEKQHAATFKKKLKTPLLRLPDGGFVAVSEDSTVTYLNADGSERQQIDKLSFKKMKSTPIVGPDGSVFFVGEVHGEPTKPQGIFSLDTNGTTRWIKSHDEFVDGGMAIDFERGYVYMTLSTAKIHVLDINSGATLAELEPDTDNGGLAANAPIIGSDGIVYFQTSGEEPVPLNGETPLPVASELSITTTTTISGRYRHNRV